MNLQMESIFENLLRIRESVVENLLKMETTVDNLLKTQMYSKISS